MICNFFIIARRPLTVTILSDSMAKHVTGVKNTAIQSFPGATISKLQQLIATKKASTFFINLLSF